MWCAGFSDTVYAEAYVTVHQYDIVLDVHIVNRTTATLQNLNLELATMGDLKLVERPQNHTLAPGASKTIRANIKATSIKPLLSLAVPASPYASGLFSSHRCDASQSHIFMSSKAITAS